MHKKNIITALIIGTTFVLAGVGIFTSLRLYQLRGQAVAPNAPQSKLFAWDCSKYSFEVTQTGDVSVENSSDRTEPGQKADVLIDGAKVAMFDVPGFGPRSPKTQIGHVDVPLSGNFTWKVVGGLDCQNQGNYSQSATPTSTPIPTSTTTASGTPSSSPTPTATATATISPTPTATTRATGTPSSSPTILSNLCNLNFSLGARTSTPSSTPTATPTTTPTSSPQVACNKACSTDATCKAIDSSYTCYPPTSTCRLSAFPDRQECNVPATTSPTPRNSFECNSVCSSNSECLTIGANYTCYNTGTNKRCRITTNTGSSTCQTGTTGTPRATSTGNVGGTNINTSPTPVTLPSAGVGLPTIGLILGGTLLTIIAIVLAL